MWFWEVLGMVGLIIRGAGLVLTMAWLLVSNGVFKGVVLLLYK